MLDPKIEELASGVRRNAGAESLPVCLKTIAEYDGIHLQPLQSYERFHGKIEFLPGENVFVIYHPDPETYPYYSRLRFSIAHELGHFHIDEHRDALVRGETHSSEPGFRSKNPRELQADEFAAALLIPAPLMTISINRRWFLSLEEICGISERCGTSLCATAIRYVKLASETCVVVLAHNGIYKSAFFSDEAIYLKFGRIRLQKMPEKSPCFSLVRKNSSKEVQGAMHSSSSWFESKEGLEIWENCTHIGDGYTISLLSLESSS